MGWTKHWYVEWHEGGRWHNFKYQRGDGLGLYYSGIDLDSGDSDPGFDLNSMIDQVADNGFPYDASDVVRNKAEKMVLLSFEELLPLPRFSHILIETVLGLDWTSELTEESLPVVARWLENLKLLGPPGSTRFVYWWSV